MKITLDQVAQHNKDGDLWIIIDNKVYDLSKFANEHPGGKKILLKVAGQNASEKYHQFHDPSVLQKYGPQLLKGEIASEVMEDPEEAEDTNEPGTFGELVPFGDPAWYSNPYTTFYDKSHRDLRGFMRKWYIWLTWG